MQIKAELQQPHPFKELIECDYIDNLIRIAGSYSALKHLYECKRRDTSLKSGFNCVAKEARERTFDYWYITPKERETFQFKLEITG